MRLLKVLALVIGISILTLACGGSDRIDNIIARDIVGEWTGTWESSLGNGTGNIAATLTQDDTSVSGTALLSGYPCITNADVSGNIINKVIQFRLASGGDEIEYVGIVDGGTMDGEYIAISGTCIDEGSFSLTKQ